MKAKLFTIIAVLVLFISCTVKQETPVQRTITVNGTGSVEADIDQVHLYLSVETRNKDITKSAEENSQRMNAIITSLKDFGLNEKDITTSGYSVHEDRYDSKNSISYVVYNRINILFYDASKTGEIIDLAIKSGATGIQSLSFSSSKEQESLKQARLLAIKNADEKANLMAAASGLSVGKALRIIEEGTSPARASNGIFMAKAAYDEATPISMGDGKSTVTATVTIEYEMQ